MRTLILALLFATVAAAQQRAPLDRPNVVVIFLDDSGYADYSHTGHPTIETPAISKLAREGLNFPQFYSASPACTASRYGLLTGRNPRRSGIRWVVGPSSGEHIHGDEITLAEGLKEAGYATGIFGKWHLGTPNASNGFDREAFPLDQGFDTWFGTDVSHDYNDSRVIEDDPGGTEPIAGYRVLREDVGTVGNEDRFVDLTGEYRDRAVDFIKAHRDEPFFAYIVPNMPHLAIAATDPFRGTSERGLLGDTMAEIDDLVATVRATLESEGIAENTLMIFTSDNGHWIRFQNEASHSKYGEARIHIGSAGPFRDGKGSTWEGGQRVPGVFWWPGTIEPRSVRHQPASTLDIFPTVLSLAGQTPPADRALDGRDIRPFFNAGEFPGTVPEFEFLYAGFADNEIYAARKGPWKLHTRLFSQTGDNHGFAPDSGGPTNLSTPILFNVETDPSERFDVAAENPGVVGDLEGVMQDFADSFAAEGTFWD